MNFIFLMCLAWLSLAGNIFADEKEPASREWEPVSVGPVNGWTAPLCEKGKLLAQPFFFYTMARGSFDEEGRYHASPPGEKNAQYLEQLFLQYGVTDRFEVSGLTAYQENYAREAGTSGHDQGWGDSYFYGRYCFLEEQKWLPHITGIFQLKVPSGKYQKADPDKLGTDLMGAISGGGSYDHGYGITLSKKIKPFYLHADAIYSFPLAVKVDGTNTRYANYFNYDFAAEYFLGKGFNLLLEMNGFLQGDTKEEGTLIPASDTNYITVGPGIGWSCDRVQTILGYERTVAGTNTAANDTVVFTFVYTF